MKVSSMKLLVVSTLVIFLFSCRKETAPADPRSPNSEIVSIDLARQVALGYANTRFTSSSSTGTDKAATTVRKIAKEDIVSNATLPYFYVFNFDNDGGFVIVSAEKNEHPVLAYSNKGKFNTKDAPYGIVSWVETTKENIDYIRQGRFNTKKQTAIEWGLLGQELGISQLKPPPPDPGCQEYSNNTTVGPLLTTEWGQGCSYNDFCPTNTSGWRCGHVPTGCVATAMAQVMRFWQTPATTYNWASMPNTFGNTEVARLMSDAGLSVGMNYNDNGSGANHANIPGALINTFGYSSAQNINYSLSSYSTVESQLGWGRPVILSGYNVKNTSWFGLVVEYQEGHEWVCDGFSATDYFWCNPDGTSGGAGYLYFHMNWGWDGGSNGWYGFDNWAPWGTGLNFQYYRRAIINIHP